MSKKIVSSIKTEARAAGLFGEGLPAEQVQMLSEDYRKRSEHELEKSRRQSEWALSKDRLITYGAVVGLGIVLLFSLLTVYLATEPPKVQWAGAVCSAIVSGVFSFLAGKATKS